MATFDWTDPSTWMLQQSERIAFSESAIVYCDNAASRYPDAVHALANLREVAVEFADIVRGPLDLARLDGFLVRVAPVLKVIQDIGAIFDKAYGELVEFDQADPHVGWDFSMVTRYRLLDGQLTTM